MRRRCDDSEGQRRLEAFARGRQSCQELWLRWSGALFRSTSCDDDVIAAMQLYDLDGVQRHDRDVVAGNEANFGLGRSEAAAI